MVVWFFPADVHPQSPIPFVITFVRSLGVKRVVSMFYSSTDIEDHELCLIFEIIDSIEYVLSR